MSDGDVTLRQIIDWMDLPEGMTKKQAYAFSKALIEEIKKTLIRGKSFHISGFGKFRKQLYRARKMKGIDGEVRTIPDRVTVLFKAGKDFKNRLN